jgi:hypothetical protein
MPVTVDTIRDLILDGYTISICCDRYPCTNYVKADLVEVARRRGLDWRFGRTDWPYRCNKCGSERTTIKLLPDPRPSSNPERQRDVEAWKALVKALEWELEQAKKGAWAKS